VFINISSFRWSEGNTHTHKGPSDKSLFFHKVSTAKPTPPTPPLFHQENATVKYQFSNYNGNIYWHLCFPLFHFSVSWCTSTQYSTWQTQHLVTLIMIQTSALSTVLHVLVLTGNGLNWWVGNRHTYVVKKKGHEEILTAERRTFACGPILH